MTPYFTAWKIICRNITRWKFRSYLSFSFLLCLTSFLSARALGCHTRAGVLEGQVQDIYGLPVKAEVAIAAQATRVHTASDGRFALPYVPGRFTVTVFAPGFFLDHLFMDLYEAVSLRTDRIVLVPEPPDNGLWYAANSGYQWIVEVYPTVGQTPELGALAPSHRTVELAQQAAPICMGHPLILLTEGSSLSPPVSAWIPGPDGLLWIEGRINQETLAADVAMRSLSERAWRLDPNTPGLLVLVPESTALRLGDTALYYLEVKQCQ